MKKVEINSYTDFLRASEWCTDQFGSNTEIWTTDPYPPPWRGYEIEFKTLESYALFMLTFG